MQNHPSWRTEDERGQRQKGHLGKGLQEVGPRDMWFASDITKVNHAYSIFTVMPLRSITVALFPVWKWDRGQLLFKAKEIEYASCKTEN
jgi:hypothetical protein